MISMLGPTLRRRRCIQRLVLFSLLSLTKRISRGDAKITGSAIPPKGRCARRFVGDERKAKTKQWGWVKSGGNCQWQLVTTNYSSRGIGLGIAIDSKLALRLFDIKSPGERYGQLAA